MPATLTAGDTVRLRLTVANASAADGGTLTLSLAGASTLTVTGVASGTAWDVTLTNTETAALEQGTYQWRTRLVESGVTYTAASGTVTVLPDLAAMAPGDGQTWDERTLTIVEAALQGTLSGEMRRYMIGGRQVETFSLKELMDLRNQLRRNIASTRRGSAFGKVRVAFTR
jgi:hypothetical protein